MSETMAAILQGAWVLAAVLTAFALVVAVATWMLRPRKPNGIRTGWAAAINATLNHLRL